MSVFLTVFVPAYNEEKNLPGCVEVLSQKIQALGLEAEILIVDDHSQDATGRIADQLAAANPQVRVIHHAQNGGIGAAFLSACGAARGEWFILIPADLAMEPDELGRYLEKTPDADVVVGLRSDRRDYTLARKIVSFTNIHLVQLLFGMKLHQFQYISLYRSSVLHEIEIEYAGSAFFLAEILIKAKALGRRLVEVDIQYIPRLNGEASGAKFRLILRTAADMLRFWLKWLRLGPQGAAKRPPA